ncbi:MAG TPA: ATP-binding protein [Terriglobales bacterium]|nr:ATP-binding protein [Terriglobales bacterium]
MSEKPNDAADRAKSEAVPLTRVVSNLLSRNSYTLLLLLVFGVEVGVGIFVIRDLRTANVEAQRMYAGSVLGLRRIGELQYQAQETRRSTLYALTTNDSNLQVEYADQSREADRRVTDGVREYLEQARIPREVEIGQRLRLDWSAYLRVRDEVLASILEGSTREAVQLDLTGGVPSFERVRQDLEEVKRLYDEQASQRLAIVAGSSHRSVVRLIAVLGFTLLFASASIWAIQRSKMLSEVQLAKLQMDFVASVSHELRTPLAVICSAADNIADGVVEGKEQLTRYGVVIRNQTRQITELVNEILLFASTKEREVRYHLRPIKVQQIVESVIENTAELARSSGFVIEQRVDPDLPYVRGDLSALSQCLQNLIVNAVKYSGESRWIGVRATVDQAHGRNRKEVRISVQDRGIGIAAPELSQIFEPFYRSPAVSAAQIHGTGLGLPLAKNIAEAMGGTLSVESELGAGSVFTLHLPVTEEAQLQMAAAAPGLDQLQKS